MNCTPFGVHKLYTESWYNMLNRKYNRKIMSRLLIYDAESHLPFGEDGNDTKKVPMNKFKEILFNIIEALVKFFRQVWRAMTSTIKRLKQTRKELDTLDKYRFERSDEYLTAATTGGKHFKHPQLTYKTNVKLFRANMKLIRDITENCNEVVNQRLADLSNDNKVSTIRDRKIVDELDKKRETLDKIIDDWEQHDKFYMYKFNYDNRGVKLGKQIYTDPSDTRITSDTMFRKLITNMKNSLDALISHAEGTEELLDQVTSNRRKLFMALNKNNTDGEKSDVVSELKDVLNINLNSSRKGFGLMMKMAGGVIKEYAGFIKHVQKNFKSND